MAKASSRLGLALACSMGLVPGCVPAMAQDTETWRCTSANGHHDEHAISFAGKTVITGRIALHSADFGQQWASTAKVLTQDSRYSGASCNCAGLVATAYAEPAIVDFALNKGELSEPVAHSKFDKPITFRIEFKPGGLMSVSIGKTDPLTKATVVEYPRRDVLELSCSGADVSFLNIEAH